MLRNIRLYHVTGRYRYNARWITVSVNATSYPQALDEAVGIIARMEHCAYEDVEILEVKTDLA
jgi:hypothetical protein